MLDFNKLPSMAEEAVDTTEADEKAERIQFHREKVRNGPVKFSTPTNGQLRRAEKRAGRRALLQRRREQVRAYFAREREISVLRGQLQAVGVLPYAGKFKPSSQTIFDSTQALIRRFGNLLIEDDDQLVAEAFQAAADRYTTLTGGAPIRVEYAA